MIHYHSPRILQAKKSGKTFVKYKHFESFGRETAYAHSWGAKEKRGIHYIWLQKDETLEQGIIRVKKEYGE